MFVLDAGWLCGGDAGAGVVEVSNPEFPEEGPSGVLVVVGVVS